MKTKTGIVIILVLLGFYLSGCKENSSSAEENGESGTATFTISGDISGEKSGIADFDIVEILDLYNVIISVYDVSPQTFTIEFALVSEDPIDTIEPGDYDIGATSFNTSVFTASYLNTQNAESYDTFLGDYGGTLSITESSSDHIKGTFEFNAGKYDNESGEYVGEITISNREFHAVKGVAL